MKKMRQFLSFAIFLALLPSIAFSELEEFDVSKLLENMDKWEAARVDHYEFDMRQLCFCGGNVARQLHLFVAGSIAIPTYSDSGKLIGVEGHRDWIVGPIPRLFYHIARAAKDEPASLLVEYDSEYGYPTRLIVDPSEMYEDDKYGFWVFDFKLADN